MAHKIGDLSPEFPMNFIIDIEPNYEWGTLKITLNGTVDGTRNWYYLPTN